MQALVVDEFYPALREMSEDLTATAEQGEMKNALVGLAGAVQADPAAEIWPKIDSLNQQLAKRLSQIHKLAGVRQTMSRSVMQDSFEAVMAANAVNRATNEVLVAAFGSLADKDTGQVSGLRASVFEGNFEYLGQAVPGLERFIISDQGMENYAVILDNLPKLADLVSVQMPDIIRRWAEHRQTVKEQFREIDHEINNISDPMAADLEQLTENLAQAQAASSAAMVGSLNQSMKVGFLVVGIALLILIPVIVLFARSILRPLNRAIALAETIKDGDLSRRLNKSGRDELARLAQSLDAMADSLEDKADLARRIAQGDLTADVNLSSDKDVLGHALKDMVTNLNEVMAQVQTAVIQVDYGSTQLTDSSQALSQGASEQASSLEQITSSMTELGSQTKQNADNAVQASNLAADSRKAMETGQSQMNDMVEAMNDINASSQEIGKIIKTIDDIAFQTNLLALNAAVEAARAGKYGKGFAVVAQEVRNLAGRSAKAAKETAELIEGSVQKAEVGSDLVQKTAKALQDIREHNLKVTDLIGDIAASSNEQAQGISQVNQGLGQVEQVTHQNTASAEQTASAAEQLSGQAAELHELLDRFKLQEGHAALEEPGSRAADQSRALPPGGQEHIGDAETSAGYAEEKPTAEDQGDFSNF
jgi:methyl-accepting chemotaxis protein